MESLEIDITSCKWVKSTSALDGKIKILKNPAFQDSQLTNLVHNVTNTTPRWRLEGLSSGQEYHARSEQHLYRL